MLKECLGKVLGYQYIFKEHILKDSPSYVRVFATYCYERNVIEISKDLFFFYEAILVDFNGIFQRLLDCLIFFWNYKFGIFWFFCYLKSIASNCKACRI